MKKILEGTRAEIPATVKALYQAKTGDTTTHQRTIDASFRKLDSRRRAIILERISGKSLDAIARPRKLTRAAVSSVIKWSMKRLRKEITGESRYNVTGRK